jgi:hypothetical protein
MRTNIEKDLINDKSVIDYPEQPGQGVSGVE